MNVFQKNYVNLLLGLDLLLITLLSQIFYYFSPSKNLQISCLQLSGSKQICFSFCGNCSIHCKQKLALQLEWNPECLMFILFKRHLFRMEHRHFYDSFLLRLLVDISNCSAESLVSCPECVDDLDANSTYPVTQCSPDVNRRRCEGDTGLYISSRTKSAVVSFLWDV